MPVSEATYERVALEDPEGQWELVCGHLRRRPGMTVEHEHVARALALQLLIQLDSASQIVERNGPRLRITSGSYFVPDLCVLPRAYERRKRGEAPRRLEIYYEPMPLVVEVWSPSTGEYDVDVKLREYQQRGDLEIWRVHPYDLTLIAWIRQPDGSYTEEQHKRGAIQPSALPGVTVDLDRLFAED